MIPKSARYTWSGSDVVVAPLDQQVARLDVTVHQSLAVRGVKRARGLAQQEQGGVRGAAGRAS